MSNIMSNRNSTPEAGHVNLRPPNNRPVTLGMGQGRPNSDATLLAQISGNRPLARPSSDFYGSGHDQSQGNAGNDPQDKQEQQWLAEIDEYESTLVEMAEATQDQEFKDELAAIEQWFRVLSEAERTAALYALLQQTTHVQMRFFIQILSQMSKNHPMAGILSPANFDKDPMSTRLNDAMNGMNRLSVAGDSNRASTARPNSTASAKRPSVMDPNTINQLFPDAAAAIASEKARFTQQTGNPPTSNRNSMVDNRNSLIAPTISAPKDDQNMPQSPWGPSDGSRPKSSSSQQQPMGQFSIQPAPNTVNQQRASRPPQINSSSNIQSTTIENKRLPMPDLLPLSPYAGSGNWASMANTPMVANFNQGPPQSDFVANATAMKLAAMSTVNNRVALDDPRKYRRARSTDPAAGQAQPMPPTQFVMIGPQGQVLSQEQVMAARQQQAGGLGPRSRPSSPGIAMHGGFPQGLAAFTSPQNNGFLAAFDGSSPIMNNGLAPMNMMGMGSFGSFGGNDGYLSDHSDMMRGRSPRGRRATSKPPEDPTNPTLLQDIPSWLRSLRLHKYTDNLKDMAWIDLVELNDEDLQNRGVNALGARRKMLKVFEEVKQAKASGKLS